MRITEPRDPRERRRHRAPEADHLAAAVRLDLSLADMRARDTAAGAPARDEDEPPTGLIDLNAIRALLGQPTTGDVDPAAAAWLAGGADPDAAAVVEQVDYLDQIAQAQPLASTSLREHFDEQLAAATAAINATADQHAALELTAERLADVEDKARAALLPEVFEAERARFVPEPAGLEYTCEVLGNAFHTAPCGDAQHPPAVLDVPPPIEHEHVPMMNGRCALCDGKLTPLAELPLVFSSERGAGWRSRHDPESLRFGVRRRLTAAVPVADRMWWPGTVGDQGTEGACVGWGIVDAINARSAEDVDLTAADAAALYDRARQLDDVPGENYSGTSVLAGLKAAQEQHLIGAYDWCFGTRDVAQAVLQRGPVVVGVPWLSGMYDTGPGGLVQLAGEDTGAGHCLAVVGILLRGPQGQPGPYFVWQNSWGADYGDGGLGYIHHRDLAQLLRGVGEAAVPGV